MKLFMMVIATIVFISCNDNSSNSSGQEDSISTDPVYSPTPDTTRSDNMSDDHMNDTTSYGTADSARR